MSETKPHQFKPPLYHTDSSRNGPNAKPSSSTPPARGNDQKGWEAYRKWLSTVGGKPSSERAPLDSSIYSWKGYHTWADRVKQSWKPEDNS
jgi:hypothetical protein